MVPTSYISWTLQVLSWPRRHFIISGAGVQLFPSNFDYVFLQVFPLVLFKSLSNWIWLLIPYTGTLYSILKRGGRSEGLFLVLVMVPFTAICQFLFFWNMPFSLPFRDIRFLSINFCSIYSLNPLCISEDPFASKVSLSRNGVSISTFLMEGGGGGNLHFV